MARGLGRVFQRKGSKNWQVEYWVRGTQVRESSGSPRRRVAQHLLKRRLRKQFRVGRGRSRADDVRGDVGDAD